jgi:hypothetical protein
MNACGGSGFQSGAASEPTPSRFDSTKIIQAIPPGPYPVGSSNLEADASSGPMVEYLKGARIGNKQRYLSEILNHPESALQFEANLPTSPGSIFGVFEGKPLPIVLYAFYPTSRENARPDYSFPYTDTADNVLPHMQSATDKPVFAPDQAKFPLIVYSPGYEAHCLWDADHMKVLASHGYIVACIFYGDGRGNWAGNIGMRPVVLKQAMDYFLAHPDYRDAIDTNRIGISGSSFGGYTVLAALGGLRVSGLPAMPDARVKVGFASVPALDSRDYFSPNGLAAIHKPFLAVYAGKDVVVRKQDVELRIKELQGPTVAVRFDNEEHVLSKAAWPLVHTWEVLFFDAWLKGDEAARQALYSAGSVAGDAVNRKTWQSGVPD